MNPSTVLGQLRLLTHVSDDDVPELLPLCAAAESRLRQRLRNPAQDFSIDPAADGILSRLAAAEALCDHVLRRQNQSASDFTTLRAGDLTIEQKNDGAELLAAKLLLRKANTDAAPYLRDTDFYCGGRKMNGANIPCASRKMSNAHCHCAGQKACGV
jgi:hypothetical protein